MQQAVQPIKGHSLTLEDRKALSLDGVEDVASFDEGSITCRTALGDIVIEGGSLRIRAFEAEKGELSVEGEISALYYNDKKSPVKSGLLSFLKR
ncbi:MAG: sporulation protein YabP [Clostridia bacterium]|nr:sporulation protein YabP [Clostridia bacterium]